MAADDYRAINHANWESRVPHHASSDEYGLDRYRNDPYHLSSVVRFDLPRLGDIAGLDVVHLQCHIGTDTLSLARLGATVTGLDFSGSALDEARRLSAEAGPRIDYVESDVYDAPSVLGPERFDLVFTGIGALCWLPDVRRWAEVVADLLRPGGRLFLREGHPVIWAMDDPRPDGLVALEYPYFETEGVSFSEDVTYVGHDEPLAAPEIVSFNHGLAEIFNALWSAGLEITAFEEHDSVPWPALGDQMEDIGGGEFRLIDRPERLPHSYTLQARRI
jgi:SAM-dependent methyltransferase